MGVMGEWASAAYACLMNVPVAVRAITGGRVEARGAEQGRSLQVVPRAEPAVIIDPTVHGLRSSWRPGGHEELWRSDRYPSRPSSLGAGAGAGARACACALPRTRSSARAQWLVALLVLIVLARGPAAERFDAATVDTACFDSCSTRQRPARQCPARQNDVSSECVVKLKTARTRRSGTGLQPIPGSGVGRTLSEHAPSRPFAVSMSRNASQPRAGRARWQAGSPAVQSGGRERRAV